MGTRGSFPWHSRRNSTLTFGRCVVQIPDLVPAVQFSLTYPYCPTDSG
jgi:hypothetical protein